MSAKEAQDKILQCLEPKGETELSLEELKEKSGLPKTTLHRNIIKLMDDKKIKQKISAKEKGIGEKTVFYIPPTLEERMQKAIDEVLKHNVKTEDGKTIESYSNYNYENKHKIAVLMEMSEDDLKFKELFAKFENKLRLTKDTLVNISVQKNES